MSVVAEVNASKELKRFSLADDAIARMAGEYMPLTIRDVTDTEGFKAVHEARMVVKNHRVEVEKTRKALKADALEYGRKVDAEAKRITALLEPIEEHLRWQEVDYEAAKEAIRNAARLKAEAEERAKREAEEARLRAEREAEEAKARAEREAEAERLRVERMALEAERRVMEAERARVAAEQKAAQDKIDAENRRLAVIEAARLRKIEDERIAKEAAERARIATEQRIAREAAAKKAAEEAAEVARVKAEALRPDREKLLTVASCVAGIDVPYVSSPEAVDAARKIEAVLRKAQAEIKAIVALMVSVEDLI